MTPRQELIERLRQIQRVHWLTDCLSAQVDAVLDAALAECRKPMIFKGVGHFGGTAPDTRPPYADEIIGRLERLREAK